VRETFCSICMRTVYRASDDGDSCPVCSSALVLTAQTVKVSVGSDAPSPLAAPDEDLRIAAVNRYEILDTPADGAFDRITRLAARIFNVPIATITVVDRDRIWFKSKYGIDAVEIGRDAGLCASAVLDYEPWVVNDAAADPRTLENPLVRGELGLRFYAGVPLTTADRYNLGTLNIIDTEPRSLTAEQLDTLQQLADIVVDELELRLSALRLCRNAAEQGVMLSA
jgi:GAF domain-containing protein